MICYLARQFATIIPTILATTLIAFVLIHTAPGEPASIFSRDMVLAPQQRQALRTRYGLDQPLPVQYEQYSLPFQFDFARQETVSQSARRYLYGPAFNDCFQRPQHRPCI